MIEFNGWITINMHANDNLDIIDGSDLAQFFIEMEPLISAFNKYPSRFIERKRNSFIDTYFVSGFHNHVLTYFDDLITLCNTIAKKAPGSFGLIYVRFPEDSNSWNKYRVFRIAKGVVTEHEDTLLSPCRPTIEDE
jgi:hypothetical protein